MTGGTAFSTQGRSAKSLNILARDPGQSIAHVNDELM